MMRLETVKRLAHAEYAFASIDAALADLANDLHACAGGCGEAGPAALELRRLRRRLRHALDRLDRDVTAAARELELIEAPF